MTFHVVESDCFQAVKSLCTVMKADHGRKRHHQQSAVGLREEISVLISDEDAYRNTKTLMYVVTVRICG